MSENSVSKYKVFEILVSIVSFGLYSLVVYSIIHGLLDKMGKHYLLYSSVKFSIAIEGGYYFVDTTGGAEA